MAKLKVYGSRPILHVCSVCGTSGVWSGEWSWYGCWLDYETPDAQIVKICSDQCAPEAEALYRPRKYIPHGSMARLVYLDKTEVEE